MGANFPALIPSSIPEGEFIAAVLSVAGGSGANPSGCIYQNGVAALRNGWVYVAPQVWYGAQQIRYNIGVTAPVDAIAWYVEIEMPSPQKVKMTVYFYTSWAEFEYNVPETYTYIFDLSNTPCQNDNTLLIGAVDKNGKIVKFIQFGIEASAHIGDSSNKWRIQTYDIAYYSDGVWRYLSAKSTLGSKSYITYINDDLYRVGGEDYTGANKDYVRSDAVIWAYTGNTMPADTILWSDSGTTLPYPYS